MKGLNRKVIEIVETNSELIERVIVILKPGVPAARLRDEHAQIEQCISGISCKKRLRWGWITAGAAAVILLAVLLIVFL